MPRLHPRKRHVSAAAINPSDLARFTNEQLEKKQVALRNMSALGIAATLAELALAVTAALQLGRKVLFFGNGGSAADAQHLAAELVGRQNYDRPAAAGLALTVDTSALTAIANDYSYEHVYARQIDALGNSGDIAWGISTSGRSPNVVEGLVAARSRGLLTVAFTGSQPREMAGAHHLVAVPADDTATVQELQMICGHAVLALVERMLFPEQAPALPPA